MGRRSTALFGVVKIEPGFDPVKARVHLHLHGLAPQVVCGRGPQWRESSRLLDVVALWTIGGGI